MKKLFLLVICTLCLVRIRILVTPNGECLEIQTDKAVYDCTEDVKIDTACWDEDGNTQLCGAKWIQVEDHETA
jgi:hypothetical protein